MVVPLRKQNDDGIYSRPPEIEQALVALYQLPIEEIARRAEIGDNDDPEFVPTECVLHFVRQSQGNGDSLPYRNLFMVLRQRVLRAVPVRAQRISGKAKQGESDLATQVQEKVLFDFQKMVCSDRNGYDERLDYYEVRFNDAIATLRSTAWRSINRTESRRQELSYESHDGEMSAEMEQALNRIKNTSGVENGDFPSRICLLEAISFLPPDDRRVIELVLQDLPNTSKTPGVPNMASILKCDESTVRYRIKKAIAALALALKAEEIA